MNDVAGNRLKLCASCASHLVGALDDFMSCSQPLSMSMLLRRARALPSHAICHLSYVPDT